MACLFYSSAFGPAGLQAHILTPPDKKRKTSKNQNVKFDMTTNFINIDYSCPAFQNTEYAHNFPLLCCEVNRVTFS